MAESIAVLKRKYNFFGKDPMLVSVFFEEFKSALDVCRILENAEMWILKQVL